MVHSPCGFIDILKKYFMHRGQNIKLYYTHDAMYGGIVLQIRYKTVTMEPHHSYLTEDFTPT